MGSFHPEISGVLGHLELVGAPPCRLNWDHVTCGLFHEWAEKNMFLEGVHITAAVGNGKENFVHDKGWVETPSIMTRRQN